MLTAFPAIKICYRFTLDICSAPQNPICQLLKDNLVQHIQVKRTTKLYFDSAFPY